jgi:hypothetical protein
MGNQKLAGSPKHIFGEIVGEVFTSIGEIISPFRGKPYGII